MLSKPEPWPYDIRWQTWWFRPGFAPIVLDGYENGHWRHMVAHPELVEADPDFASFLKRNDVEEDSTARQLMKHAVFRSGWVRIGLFSDTAGYVDGVDVSSIKQAATFLLEHTGDQLQALDVTKIPRRLEDYWSADIEELGVALDRKGVERLVSRGMLPKPRRFVPMASAPQI